MGVAWSLAQEGVHVGGFALTIEGDVPLGAGLSSSASIEVATAFALLELAGASCRSPHRPRLPARGKRLCRRPQRHHGPVHRLRRASRTTP